MFNPRIYGWFNIRNTNEYNLSYKQKDLKCPHSLEAEKL